MKKFANSMNPLLIIEKRNFKNKFIGLVGRNKKYFTEISKQPLLKINNQTFIKNKKIIQDLLKVHDISNFNYLAAVLQSDMYHEFLFQALSKKI